MFLHAAFETNLSVAAIVKVQRGNLIKNPGTKELKHIFTVSVRAGQKIDGQFVRGRRSSIMCVN